MSLSYPIAASNSDSNRSPWKHPAFQTPATRNLRPGKKCDSGCAELCFRRQNQREVSGSKSGESRVWRSRWMRRSSTSISTPSNVNDTCHGLSSPFPRKMTPSLRSSPTPRGMQSLCPRSTLQSVILHVAPGISEVPARLKARRSEGTKATDPIIRNGDVTAPEGRRESGVMPGKSARFAFTRSIGSSSDMPALERMSQTSVQDSSPRLSHAQIP